MSALPKRIGGGNAIYHAEVLSVAGNRSKCLVVFAEGESRRTVLIESGCGFMNYIFPPIRGQVRQVRKVSRSGSTTYVLVDARPETGACA